MAFRDYSRLFDLSGKRGVFGAAPAPDLFGGGGQHQQALAEQAAEPGIGSALAGAVGTLGGAYFNRPQPGAKEKIAAMMNKPAMSVQAEQMPLGQLSDLQFGGYRRFGGYVDPRKKYVVGENGPEMFVPDQPGEIVPMNDPPIAPDRRDPLGTAADIYPRSPTAPAMGPNDDPVRTAPWSGQGVSPLPSPQTAGTPEALEPSPYDGKARSQLGEDATPRERALQEIQDLQRAGPQRTSSMWRRVGQGVLGGLAEWAAAGMPGELGGALGAIGAGASIYGASKGAAADMEHRRKLAGLFGKYKEAVAPEMAEMERLGEMQKTQGTVLDNQRKRLDMLHKTYGPLMDQMERAGKTPEEIAEFLTKQGIPMVAQDVRERKIVYDAKGQAVSHATKGDLDARPEDSLPIDYDQRRSPLTVNVPGSDPVTGVVSDAKKMDTIVGIQEGNARMEETRANRERMQANDDRNYQLRRKQFDLDLQREARLVEDSRRNYEGKNVETHQKRVDDLGKVRKLHDELSAQASGLLAIPDEDRTEAQTAKLAEVTTRLEQVVKYYQEITDRLQKGQ